MVDLLQIALRALDEPGGEQVLADAVQERGWFDPRVMQVLWPLGKAPRHGWTTKKKRDRAKVDREAHKDGYPHMFAGFAARPSKGWARAIAAVLLFGGWRKRRWTMIARHELAIGEAQRERARQAAADFFARHPDSTLRPPRGVRTIAQQYSGNAE